MPIMDLINICKSKKSIWIQTHNFPDPDAISSAFGLKELFKCFGIEATICHEGLIDKLSSVKLLKLCGIEMMGQDETRATMDEDFSIVLIDCQKDTGNTTDLIGDEIAAIDHHPTVKEVAYEYKDVRIVGACASIVASYYKELGIEPSSTVASALLYGIRMDTLDFSRGVTTFDIDMFRYLFDFCDQTLLTELQTNNMEFTDLEAYGIAIENIKAFGKVAFSHIDFVCPDALVAALSDFILALVEIEVVVVYAKRSDGYKFSIRSERDDVHAGVLACECLKDWGNGGGHAFMAGGFVKAEVLDAIEGDTFDVVQKHCVDIMSEMWPQVL